MDLGSVNAALELIFSETQWYDQTAIAIGVYLACRAHTLQATFLHPNIPTQFRMAADVAADAAKAVAADAAKAVAADAAKAVAAMFKSQPDACESHCESTATRRGHLSRFALAPAQWRAYFEGEHRSLIIPWNLNNNHWVLSVVSVMNRCCVVIDGAHKLGNAPPVEVVSMLPRSMRVGVVAPVPQNDGHSCGPLALCAAFVLTQPLIDQCDADTICDAVIASGVTPGTARERARLLFAERCYD